MAPGLLIVAAQVSVLTLNLIILWRRFFSPLKAIPGPPLASFSRFWHIYRIIKGDQNVQLVNLHDKYGMCNTEAPVEPSYPRNLALERIL